jgi:uncharacterized protein YjbJ (UPF0337 family)
MALGNLLRPIVDVCPVDPSGTLPASATREEPMMGGTDDRAAGAWDETKGKVKEAVGDATDDESMENEGKKDQVKGKTEQAVGHVKDAAENVREGIDSATDD